MVMQDVIHQLFSESLMDEFTLFDSSVDKEQIDSILTKLELIKMKIDILCACQEDKCKDWL